MAQEISTRLRLPRSLHVRLRRQAESDGVSLHSHMVRLLGEASAVREATMTTAAQIAARYDNDGSCWTDADGRALDDALEAAGATRRDVGGHRRYELPDGSAIVVCGPAWDVGQPGRGRDCCCWASVRDAAPSCPEHGRR